MATVEERLNQRYIDLGIPKEFISGSELASLDEVVYASLTEGQRRAFGIGRLSAGERQLAEAVGGDAGYAEYKFIGGTEEILARGNLSEKWVAKQYAAYVQEQYAQTVAKYGEFNPLTASINAQSQRPASLFQALSEASTDQRV